MFYEQGLKNTISAALKSVRLIVMLCKSFAFVHNLSLIVQTVDQVMWHNSHISQFTLPPNILL